MNIQLAYIVLLLAGAAMACDLREGKVPNQLILAGYLIGAVTQIRAPMDIPRCLVSLIWPVLALYPLFLLRALGAGDIKLFSVLSVFYPHTMILQIMLDSLVIGAGMSVVGLLTCRLNNERQVKYIHYTVCIFFAYVFVLCHGGT